MGRLASRRWKMGASGADDRSNDATKPHAYVEPTHQRIAPQWVARQALLGGVRPSRRIVHHRRQLRRGEHLRRVAGGQAPRANGQRTGTSVTRANMSPPPVVAAAPAVSVHVDGACLRNERHEPSQSTEPPHIRGGTPWALNSIHMYVRSMRIDWCLLSWVAVERESARVRFLVASALVLVPRSTCCRLFLSPPKHLVFGDSTNYYVQMTISEFPWSESCAQGSQ